MKECSICKEYKQKQEFYRDKDKKDGLYAKCKKCIAKQRWEHYRNTLLKNKKKWLSYLPKNPKCEICNKRLYYSSKDINKRVYFDHKKENLPIQIKPSIWLIRHYPTTENILIWQSCNFGILCNSCNILLPLKHRGQWLKKALIYFGSK